MFVLEPIYKVGIICAPVQTLHSMLIINMHYMKVVDVALNGTKEDLASFCEKQNISLTTEDKTLEGKLLVRVSRFISIVTKVFISGYYYVLQAMMSKWLPAADALLELICVHLP